MILTLLSSTVGCSVWPFKKSSEVKVGFIYIGDPADGGFTLMHDEGRKYMVEKLGVQTAEVHNVDDTDSELFKTKAKELIDQGYNFIIGNSYGFGQPLFDLSKEFPKIKFLHFSGDHLNKNMGNFFGKMYEARFVAGAVTGMNIPEGGVVGYVAAFPIPEVVRGINAFALGLRSTNPDATVIVTWTSTWFDPDIEKQTGKDLIDLGADAITIHQDTPRALEAATEAGKWGIGYHTDMSSALGDDCLISAYWNFGPYYVSQMEAVENGTWKAEHTWGGYEDGENNMVAVSEVSPKAKSGSQDLADELVAKISTGELHVFRGPIKDNNGNLQIIAGEVCEDDEMWNMMWYVEGVVVTN